jgi:DNA repair ATPase RecN
MNKQTVYTVQQYFDMVDAIQDARKELEKLRNAMTVTADELITVQSRMRYSSTDSKAYKVYNSRYRALHRKLSECYRLIDAQDQIIDVIRGKMMDYDRMTFDQYIAYNEPVSSERFAKIGVVYSE